MKKQTTTLLLSLLTTLTLSADKTSIEIDPATYAFSGYSVHLKHSFDELPKIQFGLGIYAMDFPDILVDIDSSNKDKGWDVRLDRGIGLFADVYSNESQNGWFYGGQIAEQKYELSHLSQTESYNIILLMAHGGYKYDVNEKLYLKFWGGVGYAHQYSGETNVAGVKYDVPRVVPFGAMHVGYNF